MASSAFTWRCPACGRFQTQMTLAPGLDQSTRCPDCGASNSVRVQESTGTRASSTLVIEVPRGRR